MIKVSPSLLAADFGNLEKELSDVKESGAEFIHLDVMDGLFVNNISFGIPVIKSLRAKSDLFFDTHLMIIDPLRYIKAFSDAGSDMITFHFECDSDIDETIASIKDKTQDIAALNDAYNAIIAFIREKVGYTDISNTAPIIEELVADDELREEFNALFGQLSRMFDRVLPDPAALEYSDDFRLLSFIRESVAKATLDPRLSMKDASKKVRAIIEEYLQVNGVDVEIEPVSLLSDDFLNDVKAKNRSDRAACDRIKYAVRQYINVNTPKDPELFMRLSERLEAILQEFRDNWADLRDALEHLREDIVEGRARENTFGYEPEHEMPFFAMLKTELYGNVDYTDIPEDSFEALKDLTNDVLQRFKTDAAVTNFWNNESMKNALRTFIINKLLGPEIKQRVPNIFSRRKDIAQKLLELGYQHFGG